MMQAYRLVSHVQAAAVAAGDAAQAIAGQPKQDVALGEQGLSLLNLREQTRRLIDEDITADVEVILSVRVIEQMNPELAGKVVYALSVERRKSNVRTLVREIRDGLKAQARLEAHLARRLEGTRPR